MFVTADRVKHYIYVVIDNFSRKILSWLIADSVNAQHRKKTIEEALRNVNETHPHITLITDGGPENRLQSFLDTLDQPIEHKVALVDVHYSNSLIEASYKTIKYNYPFRMDATAMTCKSFAQVVEDFNNRPHVSLNGLTPNEAERSISLNNQQLHSYVTSAAQERKNYNRTHRCPQCRE